MPATIVTPDPGLQPYPTPTPQPVLGAATIVALAGAAVTLLIAFDVPITKAQETAIAGFVMIVAPIVAALFVRRKVTPVEQPTLPFGTRVTVVGEPSYGPPHDPNRFTHPAPRQRGPRPPAPA